MWLGFSAAVATAPINNQSAEPQPIFVDKSRILRAETIA
jgi:hypothetical protein